MIAAWILLAALAAAPQVAVDLPNGKTVSGTLTALNTDALVLETADGPQRLIVRDVLTVKPVGTGPLVAKASLQVELVDGSLLAATAYLVGKAKARVTLAGGVEKEIPTSMIRSVRFQQAADSDKLAQQWSQIVGGNIAADLLVVRKKGAFDYLEGVLGDIDAETVHFELDKESIPVKLPKVEGLVYYHPTEDAPANLIAEVIDVHGSRLAAKSLELAGSDLKVTTPKGLELVCPLGTIARIDFSSANLKYLSDLEPKSAEYVPYFAPADALASQNEFFRPRRDTGIEQNPLRLDGKTYRKGLGLRSRSTLVYRVPGKFRHFQALAGIDDSVRDGGNVRLAIKGDGKSLWDQTVRGSEPAKTLDLDVTDVKVLEILVDFGDDFDTADYLDLCEARLTK